MVSIEEHKKSLAEFLKDIEEKVRNDLVLERQRLIGFAASEASCDIFAIFLHRKNLITPGFNINHRFFVSEKAAKTKFAMDFPEKQILLSLLVKQDEYRSVLCYGKAENRRKVEAAVQNLYEIKRLVESLLGEPL